jgi:protein-S-isoprenylcysteine O-methyltransferase Ste14
MKERGIHLKENIKQRTELFFVFYAIVVSSFLAILHLLIAPFFVFRGWCAVGIVFIGAVFCVYGFTHWLQGISCKRDWKQKEFLLTKRCYRITRHPIVSGVLFAASGVFAVFTHSFLSVIYFFLLYIFALIVLPSQEKKLIELHQLRYIYYKNCVPAIIPKPTALFTSHKSLIPSHWVTKQCFAVKDLGVNLYFFCTGKNFIAINTGHYASFVQEECNRFNIPVSNVSHAIFTQLDRQHCRGIATIKQIKIYLLPAQSRALKHSQYFGVIHTISKDSISHELQPRASFDIDEIQILALSIPGVAKCANFVIQGQYLFTGSLLNFQNGRIWVNRPTFRWNLSQINAYLEQVSSILQEYPTIQYILSSTSGYLQRHTKNRFFQIESYYPYIQQFYSFSSSEIDFSSMNDVI